MLKILILRLNFTKRSFFAFTFCNKISFNEKKIFRQFFDRPKFSAGRLRRSNVRHIGNGLNFDGIFYATYSAAAVDATPGNLDR